MQSVRSLAVVVSAIFIIIAATSLSLADDAKERLAIAAEYVEISKQSMRVDEMVEVTIDQIAETFRVQVPGFDAEKEKKLREMARPIFMEQMDRTFLHLDKAIAEIFTLEELKAMVAFMGSDLGRSIMQKMPVYLAKVQPAIMNGIQSRMPDIIRMLQEADIIPKQ